jgi:hypothetical protein
MYRKKYVQKEVCTERSMYRKKYVQKEVCTERSMYIVHLHNSQMYYIVNVQLESGYECRCHAYGIGIHMQRNAEQERRR